jgi:hypothetical protein
VNNPSNPPTNVYSGVNPNPRSEINKDPVSWNTFSIILHVADYFVGTFNVAIWYGYRDTAVEEYRNTWQYRSVRLRSLFWSAHILFIIPLAIFMSAAPLCIPYLVLPLAQEQAWLHRCDSYPMYAILYGRLYDSPPSQVPTVSFYYTGKPASLPLYSYAITTDYDQNRPWSLYLVDNSTPDVQYLNVTFDNSAATISAACAPGYDTQQPCATGTFQIDPKLQVITTDKLTNTSTGLISDSDHWYYPNHIDAPSYIMTRYPSGQNNQSIILQSAVTQPNACWNLRICSIGPPDSAIISVLGLTLVQQDLYGQDCSKPVLS